MNIIVSICTIVLAVSLLGCSDRTDDPDDTEDVPPSETILTENYRWQLIETQDGCVIRSLESGREEAIDLTPENYRDMTFDSSGLHLLGEDYSYSIVTPFSETSADTVWYGSRKSQIESFGSGSYLAHTSTRIDYVFDKNGEVIRTAQEIVPMGNFLLLYDNSGREFRVMTQDLVELDAIFDRASLDQKERLVIGNSVYGTWQTIDPMSDNHKSYEIDTLIDIAEFGAIGEENGSLIVYSPDGILLADYGPQSTDAEFSWEYRPDGMLGAPGGYFFRFGKNSQEWFYLSGESYGPVSEFAVVENERFVLTHGENGWEVWNRFVQTKEDIPPVLGIIPYQSDGTFRSAIIVETDEKLPFDLSKFLVSVPTGSKIVADCIVIDNQLYAYNGDLCRLGSARGEIIHASPLMEGGEITIDGGGYLTRYYIWPEFPDFGSFALATASPDDDPLRYKTATALVRDGDQLATVDLDAIDILNDGSYYIKSTKIPVKLAENWNGYELIFNGNAGFVMRDGEVLLSGYGSFSPVGENLIFFPTFLQNPRKTYDAELNPIAEEADTTDNLLYDDGTFAAYRIGNEVWLTKNDENEGVFTDARVFHPVSHYGAISDKLVLISQNDTGGFDISSVNNDRIIVTSSVNEYAFCGEYLITDGAVFNGEFKKIFDISTYVGWYGTDFACEISDNALKIACRDAENQPVEVIYYPDQQRPDAFPDGAIVSEDVFCYIIPDKEIVFNYTVQTDTGYFIAACRPSPRLGFQFGEYSVLANDQYYAITNARGEIVHTFCSPHAFTIDGMLVIANGVDNPQYTVLSSDLTPLFDGKAVSLDEIHAAQ